MDEHRQLLRMAALGGAVATILITGGLACGGPEASVAAVRAPLSGEEVFRGLVFGEGAVAELFPEFGRRRPHREFTAQQKEAQERVKSQLMTDIRQEDPGFFDHFGVELQSGDHLRVERALNERTTLLKQVALKQKRPAAKGSKQGTCCVVLMCDVILASYDLSYEYDAIWVLYAFADADAYYSDESYANDEASSYNSDGENAWAGARLRRDELIEMIATRLVAG